MNIYVDKLPESCECCPCNDDYYRCGLSGDLFDEHDTYTGRMKNCKLKQLADVVEVVRCKDCKYMTEHYDVDGNAPYWTCSEWDSGTDYDGFCSYGERADT